MKKKSVGVCSNNRSDTFPSPGTPPTNHLIVGGWSSERVPLPATNYSRRYYLPSNNNGRNLPSKWEDAEKWIFSPGERGVGASSHLAHPQSKRRPKSKSGPLGPPAGMASYYSAFSPSIPVFDSDFEVGGDALLGRQGCCVRENGDDDDDAAAAAGGGAFPADSQSFMVRSLSNSIHEWSDPLMESSSSPTTSQDEKFDSTKDAATMISPAVSRRDMATQMSPEGSTCLSPKEKPSSSRPSSVLSIGELQSQHFSKLEVRDVQVDDRVTLTRWSKKHGAQRDNKDSTDIEEWKKKAVEARATAWEAAETAKCVSKYKREEAKITAWENSQKAKAEAEIRKLEMKLEKKRSASMLKIMKKLRSAQRKAQEMRSSVAASQADQVIRTADKAEVFRKTGQMGSLSGCFTCHAF